MASDTWPNITASAQRLWRTIAAAKASTAYNKVTITTAVHESQQQGVGAPVLQADAVEVLARAVAVPDVYAALLQLLRARGAADEPQQLLHHACILQQAFSSHVLTPHQNTKYQ